MIQASGSPDVEALPRAAACYPAGMMLRMWWWSTMLLGLASALPAQRPPNVVLIVADDLGYGELGCYGQDEIATPHLDALAAQGMKFTQFYAGAPVCAPSRCVLLTGHHLGHASVRDNREHEPEGQEPLLPGEVSWARLLHDAGYATGGYGKWGLGYPGSIGDPRQQGFDHFFGFNCQRHAHDYYPRYLWDDDARVELDGSKYAPELITDAALGFLERHRQGPFLLYVPSTLPHLALQVPDASLQQYRGRFEETPYIGRSYRPNATPRATYAAMISHLDADVGRILARLRVLGLERDTLVIFTSDNGPTHLREQVDVDFFRSAGGLRGLKGSVFEGGIRVPMLARWPGHIAPGSESGLVAGFVDVLPTLCELAGIAAPADADGVSLLPTLLGRGGQRQHDSMFWDFPGYGGQLAVRMGRWKAVRVGMIAHPDARLQLFDLQADPGERHDVAAEHPDVVEQLAAIMLAARREPEFAGFRFGQYGK